MNKRVSNTNNERRDKMGELSKLLNIGPVVEEQLNQVGITTYDQLKEIGSRHG